MNRSGVRLGNRTTSSVAPLGGMLARPFLEARDDLIHVAMRLPFGIERDRLIGDSDVFLVSSGTIEESQMRST